jgi:hypothetical protein
MPENAPAPAAAPAPAPAAPPAPAPGAAAPGKKPTAPAPAAPPATPEGGVPPEGGEKPPEKPAEPPRRHKLKVDGKEVEVDDEELKRGYQLSKASYQRMEQVAALRKELESFQSAFKQDPVAVMRQLAAGEGNQSKAFRDAVEKFLYDEYQKERMDPRERALLEREEKLRAEEQRRQAWAQEQEELKLQQQQAYWAKKYDEEIGSALADPDVGLPKTAATVKRMAELMSKALQAGLDVPAKDVARIVRDEQAAAQRELFSKLDGAQLYRLLGDEVVKRLRTYELAQVRRTPVAPPAAPEGERPPARKPETKKQPMSEREFDEYVKRLARGEA